MTITIKRGLIGRVVTFVKLIDAAFVMLVFGELNIEFRDAVCKDKKTNHFEEEPRHRLEV